MFSPKLTSQIFCLFFIIDNFSSSLCSKDTKNLNKQDLRAREMSSKKLFAVDFEVYGKVQGVFFRKHTEKQAKSLGMHGWCMNTPEGTVKGQLEGPQNEINEMKHWLQCTGSPKSRIDKTIFSEIKEIPDYTYKAFSIKR